MVEVKEVNGVKRRTRKSAFEFTSRISTGIVGHKLNILKYVEMIRRIFETFDYEGKIEVFEPQRERKEMEVSQVGFIVRLEVL